MKRGPKGDPRPQKDPQGDSDHNRHNGIDCIDLSFLHCVMCIIKSNLMNERTKTLLCIFKWFLKLYLMTFSIVGLRMYPYIGWSVVRQMQSWLHLLFSTVHFQLYPQIGCMRRDIVRLGLGVWESRILGVPESRRLGISEPGRQ